MLLLVLVAGGCGDSGPVRPITYKIKINNGWPKIVEEEEVGGFIENAWHDPVGPTIAINTRLASETGSPMANAQLAQVQTSKLPDYRERGLKWMKVGGRPTVRWSFDMSTDNRESSSSSKNATPPSSCAGRWPRSPTKPSPGIGT